MLRRAKRPPDEEMKLLMPCSSHTAQIDDGGLILYEEKVGACAWSKDDEITILKGLVNFKTEKGIKSKKIDYVALYESIKQSLHRQSATQLDLQKKIRCLREKYKNNLKRVWNPSTPHEEELFYLSDRVWGEVNKHHHKHQQLTCQSMRPCQSLDPEASDKIFVGDLGLALTTISRNHSNPLQVALEQYKLVSQSLSTRKIYGNQILEARITPKKEEHSELEEQKIARSYFNTKIQHAQLVSDAYNASHGFENSLINVKTDGALNEDTPKAMNEGNCPPATIGCRKPITGKPSDTSPKSVSETCHSQARKEKKKRKIENQEKHCDSSIQSQERKEKKERKIENQEKHCDSSIQSQERKEKKKRKIENREKHCDSSIQSQERKEKKKRKIENREKHCDSSIQSQEREEKKKRKIENQEKHCDSSIQSQLEMENRNAVANAKDINESATSTQIHTLPDGLAVEVLVKGKADGKVASLGKQVKINFMAKLRDTGCTVGSNIGSAPHQFCLGYKKVLKGLNIGIEGMRVGEKRRLTIPPSLGHGSKAKPPILPDSWLLYEVELVDICE